MQERIALLAVAFLERSGISRAWLKRYVALAGYDVEIQEFRELRAGHSAAGDALTNGGWIFTFLVVAAGGVSRTFKSGRSSAHLG